MNRPEGALREALESRAEVRLAVLFGSAARGTAGRRSDLDVGVILEEGLGLTEVESALARAAGRRVEVVRLDTAPPLLRFEIARDAATLTRLLVCNERTPRVVEGLEVLPLA